MKSEGQHFIIHGLFIDDMMHIATKISPFMEQYRYSKDSRRFHENVLGHGMFLCITVGRLPPQGSISSPDGVH
jgi:hypothetical protein